jgi:hypothetical protein
VGTEPAVLVLLREALEHELPGEAAALFFEALRRRGPEVPSSFAGLVDFVGGPLRAVLSAQCGAARAAEIVRRLEDTLKDSELPTQAMARLRAPSFGDETTANLAAISGPLDLVVLSMRGAMASQFGAVFDRTKVSVSRVRNADELARVGRRVDVAVVDLTDLPALAAEAIARSLVPASVVLVWGSEAKGAEAVVTALEREGARCVSFASNDPVEPMLDVVRSRIT